MIAAAQLLFADAVIADVSLNDGGKRNVFTSRLDQVHFPSIPEFENSRPSLRASLVVFVSTLCSAKGWGARSTPGH